MGRNSRYKVGDRVLARKRNNAMGNTYPAEVLAVAKGERAVGRGQMAEQMILTWLLIDTVTFRAFQPERLYTYTVRYDDGYTEEMKGADMRPA